MERGHGRELAPSLGGRAHGEAFGAIRPASTMAVVKQLLNDEWLVEIEADAVIE